MCVNKSIIECIDTRKQFPQQAELLMNIPCFSLFSLFPSLPISLYLTVYKYICMCICACLHLLICWQEMCFKFREPAKKSWQYVFCIAVCIIYSCEIWIVNGRSLVIPLSNQINVIPAMGLLIWISWLFHSLRHHWVTLIGALCTQCLGCCEYNMKCSKIHWNAGIFLCMCPANEIWHYNVTSSLIGWVHSQNEPWNE